MKKPADTRYPIHELLRARWSPRSFAPVPVPADTLGSLLEAARWAPSCFNAQPWRFAWVLRGSLAWERWLDVLIDANRVWAKDAGALIAVVSKRTFEHNGKPAPTASFDTGSAWMSMALQAQHMGLVTHGMWGFHHERAPAALNLSDDYQVEAMVAVGKPGNAADLPEPYAEREVPSERKPLAELAFEGTLV